MFVLQEISEGMNTFLIADIKCLELNRRLTPILHEDLRGFELRVGIQGLYCFGAAFWRSCC